MGSLNHDLLETKTLVLPVNLLNMANKLLGHSSRVDQPVYPSSDPIAHADKVFGSVVAVFSIFEPLFELRVHGCCIAEKCHF